MPEYRRRFQLGGTFFFTVVRHQRYPANWACTCRGVLREPPVVDDLEETTME